jgi:hypothetical protein
MCCLAVRVVETALAPVRFRACRGFVAAAQVHHPHSGALCSLVNTSYPLAVFRTFC